MAGPSRPDRSALRWERFLLDFALPLCEGGAVHVGAPLGPRGLGHLAQAVAAGLDGGEAGERLSLSRHRLMAEHLLRCEPPLLSQDPGALALLCALHDLLFSLHPEAQGLLGGRAVPRLLLHAQRLCQRAAPGPAADASLLCARHSLLHGLFTLSRDDVRVTFWAGRREFQGQVPPARLLTWRSLRRVREERWRVLCYLQLAAGPGREAFLSLLRGSPLSDLLAPRRLDPPLDLLAHAPLLRRRELRRAVLARYLNLGLAEIGGPLGTALLRLLGQAAAAAGPDAADRERLAAVLGFVSELVLCCLLAEAPLPPLGEGGALRDLLGVFCALALRWPFLALPRDVAQDPQVAGPLRARTEELVRAIGRGRLDEIIGLCARAIGREPAPAPVP